MRISKTNYIQFRQCNKLFWTAVHAPEQTRRDDELDRFRQDEGRQVELYARQLFSKKALVIQGDFNEILFQSREAVCRPIADQPICNSIIQANSLIAEIDMLYPMDDGSFDIYEIKSSTNVSPHHLYDVAFQWYVCREAGIEIRRCYVLTINNRYVRDGGINPKSLFTKNDITDAAANLLPEIEKEINQAKTVLAGERPETSIGAHCDNPYSCPLKPQCWANVNAIPNNIFSLNRLPSKTKWALHSQGIIKNADIPAKTKLMPRQKIQIQCEASGEVHFSQIGLDDFLDKLIYPLYFLDFETLAPAVPMLDGTKPYQQIPFQFSLHRLDALDAEPVHDEWLWDGGGDVWSEFLSELQNLLGTNGSVIAYNASFEKRILKAAVTMRPAYQDWLDGVLERVVDLLVPFRNFIVYHHEQHGSASLKSVLPTWTGRGYDELSVKNGEMAGWMFRHSLEIDDHQQRKKIRRDLEEYCGLDTLGMILILRKLLCLKSGKADKGLS